MPICLASLPILPGSAAGAAALKYGKIKHVPNHQPDSHARDPDHFETPDKDHFETPDKDHFETQTDKDHFETQTPRIRIILKHIQDTAV